MKGNLRRWLMVVLVLFLVLMSGVTGCGKNRVSANIDPEELLTKSINTMLALPAYRLRLQVETDIFSKETEPFADIEATIQHQPPSVYLIGTIKIMDMDIPLEMYLVENKAYAYLPDPENPGHNIWTVTTQPIDPFNKNMLGGNPDAVLTAALQAVKSVERLPDEKSQPAKDEADLAVLRYTLDPSKMQSVKMDLNSQLESAVYTVKIWKDSMRLYSLEGELKGKVTPTGQEKKDMTMRVKMKFTDTDDVAPVNLPEDVRLSAVPIQ